MCPRSIINMPVPTRWLLRSQVNPTYFIGFLNYLFSALRLQLTLNITVHMLLIQMTSLNWKYNLSSVSHESKPSYFKKQIWIQETHEGLLSNQFTTDPSDQSLISFWLRWAPAALHPGLGRTSAKARPQRLIHQVHVLSALLMIWLINPFHRSLHPRRY